MGLIYFVLCAFGLTQILSYSRILEPIRPKHHFFRCPMCIGFHVGWFLWAINGFTELFTFDYSLTNAFVLSCVSSGTSYVLSMIFGDEGINFKIWGEDSV